MKSKFNLMSRLRSFRFAFEGLWVMLKTQHNCWVHLVATAMVIGAGVFFRITLQEWSLLVVVIMMVWIAEGFNTALEFLSDAVSTDFHLLIKRAKDVAAASVLIAAVGAVVVGLLVFLPHMLSM